MDPCSEEVNFPCYFNGMDRKQRRLAKLVAKILARCGALPMLPQLFRESSMPTRNIVLTGHAGTAKLRALREASRIGFVDLDEGYMPADRLEDFIAGLGREAAERVNKTGA